MYILRLGLERGKISDAEKSDRNLREILRRISVWIVDYANPSLSSEEPDICDYESNVLDTTALVAYTGVVLQFQVRVGSAARVDFTVELGRMWHVANGGNFRWQRQGKRIQSLSGIS